MAEVTTLSLLSNVFGEENVIKEWDVADQSEDALQRGIQYCPRIDFAIKPLNIDNSNILGNREAIIERYYSIENFFNILRMAGISNRNWTLNRNPRCFLAIEYENKTTTKHRFGSLLNACAIGCVGIVVTLNDRAYFSYDRIVNYMDFIDVNDKLRIHPTNYIIVTRNIFEGLLRAFSPAC